MTVSDRAAFDAYLDFTDLFRSGRVAANWLPDGRFWFVEGAPEDTRLTVFDPADGSVKPLFDTAAVRTGLKAVIGREPPYRGLPFDAAFPAGASWMFVFEGREYMFDPQSGAVAALPKPSFVDDYLGISARVRLTPNLFTRSGYMGETKGPEMLSPDGRSFAGLDKDGDVALRSTADGRYEKLTRDAEPDYGWDVETMRMGLAAGGGKVLRTVSPWSPDSLKLFALRFDARRVGRMTRTHLLGPVDQVESIQVTRAGSPLPTVTPYVIDVNAQKPIPLSICGEDCFLLLLGWTLDSRGVYVFRISRDQKRAEVFLADAATGEARLLIAEQGETFIRIQHDVIGGRPGCYILPQGQGFLWESERDGWRHLYHYDGDGQLVRQVTTGDWPVCEVLSSDAADGFVYFTAHHDQARPYDVHFCRAPLAGGPVERLTEEPGIHEIQLSPDREVFVDTVQRPDLPPQSEVRTTAGRRLHTFPPADRTGLDALGWSPPEQVAIKAADGESDLWAVVYRPRDFDPSKSYPVIDGLYGGPQVSWANHGFAPMEGYRSAAINVALSQLGYVVVVVDSRGTPERSKAFQDVAYGDFRRHVTADHAAALRNLAEDRPWMDLGRVGVWGHSWGGYFTFANMIDNPELFRAGVASAPGFDPYLIYIYEPYIGGVPGPDTKAAYDDALLYGEAGKLQGELMIVIGSCDPPSWISSATMANALVEAGKPHEFVMLTGQQHGYGSAHERYFIDKLVAHFDRHVKNAGQ